MPIAGYSPHHLLGRNLLTPPVRMGGESFPWSNSFALLFINRMGLKMKFRPIHKIILVVVGMLLQQFVPAMANDTLTLPTGASQGHTHILDRIQQVQHGLDELKAKLNLAAGQNEAWNTWSAGVSENARQQFERMDAWHEKHKASTQPTLEGTTPERMARRIEHLRARTAFMQENLARLEAAQARTKVFYDQLDINQKTIFDLYAQQIRGRFGHFGHHCGHNGMRGSPHEDS